MDRLGNHMLKWLTQYITKAYDLRSELSELLTEEASHKTLIYMQCTFISNIHPFQLFRPNVAYAYPWQCEIIY